MNKRQRLRLDVFEKYGGMCAYCGESITLKTMNVDHVIPRGRMNNYPGVKNMDEAKVAVEDISNLMPSCRSCNAYKSVFCLGEFRVMLNGSIDMAEKYSLHFRFARRYKLIGVTGTEMQFHFEIVDEKEYVCRCYSCDLHRRMNSA